MMCFEWRCYLVGIVGLLAVGCVAIGALDLPNHEYISIALLSAGGVGIIYFVLGMVVSALHTCMFPIGRPKDIDGDDFAFGPTSRFILLDTGIPALLIAPRRTSSPTSVFIWLHGNAMTLKSCEPLSQLLADMCNAYIIIPEYPGYGIYYKLHSWSSPSPGAIDASAKLAYRYVTKTMSCTPGRIIVVGHSIGCGPATRLASIADVGGLVLISPFSNFSLIIANVINHYTCGFVSRCIASLVSPAVGWHPVEEIKKVRSPVLLLHGLLDNLISPSHSIDILCAITRSDQHIPPDQLLKFPGVWIRLAGRADHIEWEGESDVAVPIAQFTSHVVDDKNLSSIIASEIEMLTVTTS